MIRLTNTIPKKNEQNINEIFSNYFSDAINLEYQWNIENLSEGGVQLTLTSNSRGECFFLQSLINVIQQQYKHINTTFFEENDSGLLQFCCNSTEDALLLVETMTKLAQTKNVKSKTVSSIFGYDLKETDSTDLLNNLPMENSQDFDFLHFFYDEPIAKSEKHDLSNFSNAAPMSNYFPLNFNQFNKKNTARQRLFSSEEPIKKTDENEIKNDNVKQRMRQSHEIIQFEIRRRLEQVDEKYQLLWDLSINEDRRIVVKLQSKTQKGISCLQKLNEHVRDIEWKRQNENRNYLELEFICKSPEVACNFGQQLVNVFEIPPESYKRKYQRDSTPFWNNKELEKSEENAGAEITRENKIRKVDNGINSFSKANNNNLPPENDDEERQHHSPGFGGAND